MTRLTQGEKVLVACTAAYFAIHFYGEALPVAVIFYELAGCMMAVLLVIIKTFNDPKG